MPQVPTSLSITRRVLIGLARISIDPRPVLRRARDVILRPVRYELATETAARVDEMRREARARDESLAQLRTEVSEARSAEAAARQAEGEHLRAVLARIEAAIKHESERLDLAIERLDAHMAAIASALDAERHERRSRDLDLERLLTESPVVRPPGAAQRVKQMPSPIVSVILPTRDRAHCIADAIASVQAQHFTDWELIIVDDGSLDDTASVVEPFLDDRRIHYVTQAASGSCAARNHGQRLARGGLIAYLDSDNVWYPGFLSAAVDTLAIEPTVGLVYGVLVTDVHQLEATRLFWVPFDRGRLLETNFIDMNTIVHRRSLIEAYGNFDETIDRMDDWDLVLRYTEHAPARALPVLAARYRVRDDRRISTTVPYGPNFVAIKRKWYPPARKERRPRVLYAVWHYPQLSETYIETEIRCMRRWGVHVEVWREVVPVSPYPTPVPIHDGSLADAVRQSQPDLIHVHWLSVFGAQQQVLGALGVPVTVRAHGFDATPDSVRAVLEHPWVHAIYAFPHHVRAVGGSDPRLCAVPVAFDTTMFRPHAQKDRRLVVRTSAALPSKDLPFFCELAKRLPDYRFVLAGATCNLMEGYVDELRDLHERMNSPAQVMFDVPRETLARLLAEAGIYLHTVKPPGTERATPIGMPISIAEAMATGAHVLVRDLPELTAYVGDAGTPYRDIEHTAELIRAISALPGPAWKQVWTRSVDRAFTIHSDELALRPMFEDWCALVCDGQRA
jgi:glycosyltransferase involved in cell wall biosynthesis